MWRLDRLDSKRQSVCSALQPQASLDTVLKGDGTTRRAKPKKLSHGRGPRLSCRFCRACDWWFCGYAWMAEPRLGDGMDIGTSRLTFKIESKI